MSPLRSLPILLLAACSPHADPEPPALPLAVLPWVGVAADATLAGTVRDPGDTEISGAHVCAWHDFPEQLPEHARDPRCTTTDPRGNFELAALVPGPYHLHASAPRFQPGALALPVPARAGLRGEGLALTLTPGGAPIHGHVVDHEGAPIADAWVTNFLHDTPTYERGAAAAARTQADGRFTLWLSPGKHRLVTDAPGFTPTHSFHDTAEPPTRIHLGPGSEISGVVLDAATRAPIAGARVRVRPDVHRWPGTSGTAYTGADGHYRVTRLPPGKFTVRAETGNRQGDGDRVVALGLGEAVALPPIAVSSLPGVRGRVERCAGGRVDLREHRFEAIGVDGEFYIPAMEPGDHHLEMLCPGHESIYETVHVGTAPVTDAVWSLRNPAAWPQYAVPPSGLGLIRGTVVDPAGDPVPFARVHLDNDIGQTIDSDTATRGGAFALHGVEPGTYTLSAASPSTEPTPGPSAAISVAADAVAEVRLDLPVTAAPIRGHVVRDGVPLAGVVVAARLDDTGSFSSTRDPDAPRRLWGYHDTLTLTDDAGRFVLVHPIAPSVHTLWAYPPGGGEGLLARADAGSEVTLEISRVATIAGTLAGVTPTRFAAGIGDSDQLREHRLFQRTDARWGFTDVQPGTHDLVVLSRQGCAVAQVTLGPDERREDHPLTLETPGGVRGRILDAVSRGPASGVVIYANHDDPRLQVLAGDLGWFVTTSDADGRFEFLGLCPGPVTLNADTPTLTATGHLAVVGGEFRELSLALDPHPNPE